MLRDWSPFHDLAKAFAEGPVCLRVVGLTGGARALAVAELLQGASRPGLVLVRELLVEAFELGGYERVDTVVEVGQWSARGGIVDVFSPSHPNPARVEFLGDEIESIRLFDPTSQRSTATLRELAVLPLATG